MRRIGITCGDPSGLGPELIERCLLDHSYEGVEFRVYGPSDWTSNLARRSTATVKAIALSDEAFILGQPVPAGAKVAMAAMEAAALDCLNGACDTVVTGPISKALCAAQGYGFPGQTEFFAARWGGRPTMAFVGEHLRLCLATWHVPLSSVASALDEEAFKLSVRSAYSLGRRLGISNTRVLVCGLNPHAGEDGLLGMEEGDSLNPWLDDLRDEFDCLEGCVPGDTAFASAMKGEADVVVAMYHDQGLAPFKAIDFDTGVNVTLGLPYLRVSPDHGTGFGIAGKGVASAQSMHGAIELSIRMG